MNKITVEWYDPKTKKRYTQTFEGPEAEMRSDMFVNKIKREKKVIRDYRRVKVPPVPAVDKGESKPEVKE